MIQFSLLLVVMFLASPQTLAASPCRIDSIGTAPGTPERAEVQVDPFDGVSATACFEKMLKMRNLLGTMVATESRHYFTVGALEFAYTYGPEQIVIRGRVERNTSPSR